MDKNKGITKHTHYHKDGSVWAKGRQVGEWTTYDRKGQIVKVNHFGK